MRARSAPPAAGDRRLARSTATRAAVVDALLALLEAGDLRPTAPRIAAHAGVSLRSVFQHFPDLEALFAAAADRQTARLQGLARRIDVRQPLERRIADFVAQRARICEAIAPVRRAALLMEPFSREIATRLDASRAAGRREIARLFAVELAACAAGERAELLAAVDLVSGFTAWQALRAHQRASAAAARRVMARAIRALLSAPRRRRGIAARPLTTPESRRRRRRAPGRRRPRTLR